MSYLREIGCEAYMHKELMNRDQGKRLYPNAEKDRLIGYCENPPSFMVLSDGAGATVVTSRSVTLLEGPHNSGDGVAERTLKEGSSEVPQP